MTRLFARTVAVAAAMLVSGCSLLRPAEPEAPECPVCAVCEVPQCPAPQVIEKVVIREMPAPPPPQATTAGAMHLPIVGAVEWVTVEPAGISMEARIDTGAETSSIHAEDVQLVEKDGKRYVRFSLIDPADGTALAQEQRLRRRVLIKQHEGQLERRYVVRLWVTLGETRSRIEVTLSDRDDFEYPLLVGRNFLTDEVIVDVSRHHTLAR